MFIILKDTIINDKKTTAYFDGQYFTFDIKNAHVYEKLFDIDKAILNFKTLYPNDNVRGDTV